MKLLTARVREFLETLAGNVVRKLASPQFRMTMGWGEQTVLEFETEDGRLLLVPLSNVSHLTSDPYPDEMTPETPLPLARVHLANGDEYRLKTPFAAMRGKYVTVRGNVIDAVDKYFGGIPR